MELDLHDLGVVTVKEEPFGAWKVAADEGPGIYHFKGTRSTTNNSIVTTNELVEVSEVLVGRKFSYQVTYFGRWQKYHISEFEGVWRKLRMDYQGDRQR